MVATLNNAFQRSAFQFSAFQITSADIGSGKDPTLMAILAYNGTEKLLQDTANTEGFFHLIPPNLFPVSPNQAVQLYGAMPIKVFNPFYGVTWVNGPPIWSKKI
jgi:hypothetical protein